VVYVGYSPSALATMPATTLVSNISTATGKNIWTAYFRDAFVVGAIAFIFPILILVGTATRLAASRREERYAALRLVGATNRQIGIISSVDAAVSALIGTLLGIAFFTLLQPLLADSAITSAKYFSDEVTPTAAGYLIVLIGVPAASAIAALLALRRIRISPLGVSRRVTPPPQSAKTLLAGLGAFSGAKVVPIYSPSQEPPTKPTGQGGGQGNQGGGNGPGGNGPGGNGPGGNGPGGNGPGGNGNGNVIQEGNGPGNGMISCAGLRELAVLGQCAPGRTEVSVPAGNLFDDNPQFSTQPIANASSPAVSPNVSGLYLQAVLVKADSAATLEKVRTYLDTHSALSQSGTAARTFGEAVQSRAIIADTVERLIYTAVVLTLIVAGCSLAVSVGGSLVERKRPFTLLRVTGTQVATLYRVVLLEAMLPLIGATIIAAGVAYGIAVLTVGAIAPAGTPVPVPGHTYFLTMGAGLLAAVLVIISSLPLLRRITGAASVRFE
jgi:ABC-type lipoprotein release transport system permease subunit